VKAADLLPRRQRKAWTFRRWHEQSGLYGQPHRYLAAIGMRVEPVIALPVFAVNPDRNSTSNP
jgi:hypothetical protein